MTDTILDPAAGPETAPSDGATFEETVLQTAPLIRSMVLELQDVAPDLERADNAPEADPREITLAVSSEYEVRREFPFDGMEVLDHSPGSVNLERFKDGAAVIAGDHFGGDLVASTRDAWVGADRRLYVRVGFSSVDIADRELTLIREGVRRNVSIRYRIHAMERSQKEGAALPTFRATSWTPVHVALVNDPEDPSVGFGREASEQVATTVVDLDRETKSPKEGTEMTTETPAAVTVTEPDTEAIRSQLRGEEDTRRKEILSLGRQFGKNDLAIRGLENGQSVEDFKNSLLDSVKPGQALEDQDDPTRLGLSEREAKRYSFFRALRYLENRADTRTAEAAGFELEVSRAIEERTGQEARGLFIPADALSSSQLDLGRLMETGLIDQMTNGDQLRAMMHRAEMGATVATLGQKLVPTDHLGASFIDVLRNTSAVMPRATLLTGLSGNVEIPRKTVATAGTWLATEGADTAADDVTIDQVTLTASDIGAHVILRRRLMLQSSIDVENMVRTDLAMALALGIDLAAINGAGSAGVPEGFLNNSNIGDWALATDPPATHVADPQWSDVLALWKLVAAGNAAHGDLGWIMNSAHAAHFMGREKFGTGAGKPIMEGPGSMMTYPVVLSEQMNADAVAFLNFRQLVVGLWGGVDILVDPYSASKSASVVVRAIATADSAIRQEAGVAAWQDSTVA